MTTNPHSKRELKVYIPEYPAIIFNSEILDTCKKALNGDFENWMKILQVEIKNNSSDNDNLQEYLDDIDKFVVELQSGKALVEIINDNTYYDDPVSSEKFVQALRKFYNKKISTIEEFCELFEKGLVKKTDWIKKVFWDSRTYMGIRCVRYALRHGMKYPVVVNKIRYSFLGYKENKIAYYDEVVLMNNLYVSAIRFGDILGTDFEECDEGCEQHLYEVLEIPKGITSAIRQEFIDMFARITGY